MKPLYRMLGTALLATLLLLQPVLGAQDKAFPKGQTYRPYEDVATTDWYYPYAKLSQETGIMNGIQGNRFDGAQSLSALQAVAIAARLHQMAHHLPPITSAEKGMPWYTPYLDYAQAQQLIPADETIRQGGYFDVTYPRVEFLLLMSQVFPASDFPAINQVTAIPDLDAKTPLGEAVLRFYNAGVLTGADKYGNFFPDSPITRAEIAAIVCRIIEPELRVSFTQTPLPDGNAWKSLVKHLPKDVYMESISGYDGTYLYGSSPKPGTSADANQPSLVQVKDLNGNTILSLDPLVDGITVDPVQDGIFRVQCSLPTPDEYGVRYFNDKGQAINSTVYLTGTNFENGMALVTLPGTPLNGLVIDKTGAVLRSIPLPYLPTYAVVLSSGVVVLGGNDGSKVTYLVHVDTGKVQKLPYVQISNFTEGFAYFQTTGRMTKDDPEVADFGVIDSNGRVLIPPNYAQGSTYQNGYTSVMAMKNGQSVCVVLDTKGNEMFSCPPGATVGGFTKSGYTICSWLPNSDYTYTYLLLDTHGNVINVLPKGGSDYSYSYMLFDSYLLQRGPNGEIRILNLALQDMLPGVKMELPRYIDYLCADNGFGFFSDGEFYLYQSIP